jgi:hypothetical protein
MNVWRDASAFDLKTPDKMKHAVASLADETEANEIRHFHEAGLIRPRHWIKQIHRELKPQCSGKAA